MPVDSMWDEYNNGDQSKDRNDPYYKMNYDDGTNRSTDGTPLASISAKNYEVPDIDGQKMDLDAALQRSNARTGVQADRGLPDAALENSLDSYYRQRNLGDAYRFAANGQGPSAAAIGGQMAMDQAIAQQYEAGGSGANQYLAGGQGVGAMSNIGAQYGAARAQEIAAAQQGAIGAYGGARSGMLTQMGQSQDWAYQQAQLNAAQQSRNDEMARYYTGQSNQLDLDQLMAAQQYEAQKGSNMIKSRTAAQAKQQAEDERDERRTMGIANGILSAATLGIL